MWDAIASFGSDELVQEYKELHQDHFAKNPEGLRVFDMRVSARPRFHRDRVPDELKLEHRVTNSLSQANSRNGKQPGPDRLSQHAPTESPRVVSHWPWPLGLFGLGMAAVGFWRKWRALWLGGAALFIVSAAFLIFASRNQPALPAPVPSPPAPVETPTPGGSESTTPPARFKPDAWRPLPVEHQSPTGPRVKTEADIFNEKATALMAQFSARDPQDRAKYLKDCEAAAAQLLDLLNAGQPAGYRDDNWPGMVSRIVELQACTPASMDRCLAAISKWLDDPARKDTEIEAALSTMMRWEQMKPLKRDTPEYKRFENIAEMQVALFDKATPRIRGQLLRNLEMAAKIVSEPKSQMPRKLIGPERLAGLMGKMRLTAGSDTTIDGQVLMVINNRVKSQPESFRVFEPMAKEILTGGKLDPMGKLSGLNLLAAQAKTSGSLPPWMDDAGIAREIASLQREAATQGADQPAVRRSDFVSGQAMMVIRDRLAAEPAIVAKHYGEIMATIAGDKESDQALRIEAVQMAVKSGALAPAEARERFGGDPLIGQQVREAFPEQ
jgi:hypothetical protein